MNNFIKKIALGHLMSPEYKGDLLEYNKNKQEEEDKKKSYFAKIVKATRPWYQTLEAVKKTLDKFITHTGYNIERRGGNFYFFPKDETFHENKSYPMIFVLPNGDTFLSDASPKEREHEEESSKKRTPQHEPPMGAKKYKMSEGIKAIIDQLSNKGEQVRYQ